MAYVIGMDSSTQSTKAIVWDRDGNAVAVGRSPLPLSTPAPGHVEQDPADWWASAAAALREATAGLDPAQIEGLAISNQRETVALLDEEGRALAPGMVWLDERGLSEIEPLAAVLGADRLHALTGKPGDLTPVVYRLAWLRRHRPALLDAAAAIVDVHGYLCLKLTGQAVASWTSADPFGVFDIVEKRWSAPILAAVGLEPGRFPDAVAPGTLVGRLHEEAAAATGLRPGTPVFAGGGDGQCAGLGVNAARAGRIYLNLGTALLVGAWSPEPAIDRSWRTLVSATGEGYFLEAVQRAGAYFINWFIDAFAGGRADPAVFDRLEAEAVRLPVGSEGVLASTHLTGCMDPHWDPNARAAFVGLAANHGLPHLYRASLEAMTLESARALATMRGLGIEAERILAVGGGARSPLWMRMVADATGLPVQRSRSDEASALGAGMTAAVGAAWFGGFAEAASAMSSEAETTAPDPAAAAAWHDLSLRQARVYAATRDLVETKHR